MKLRILALFLFASLSGCQYRSYQEGGAKFTSWSFGTNQAVAPFVMKAGKEGDPTYRSLESKGLTNDSTSLVAAAVEAAVRAGK